ncbi:MAG TPA: sigma-54 dependent transcriptional regulator [Candidatus Krumholzibacteria bacterium]|nr:sigma-54 dependent transcriptional regulator [Candidatus Krumholzibacteria bacterium]
MTLRLFIVEDEILVRRHLETIVRDLGWEVVGGAACHAEAMAGVAKAAPDLVLMDVRLSGDGDGVSLARELREVHDMRSIFLTAYADNETLRRVEEVGALGYLVKPVMSADIGAALASARAQLEELRSMQESGLRRVPARVAVTTKPPAFQDLVGASPVMQRVFEQIVELARLDWTVLVEGETGTGKELVARALHACSPRRRGPFVAVNCGGLTDSLLASHLFGHRRGAFTDAVCDQPGLFESAHGGTLFLDEIGDMSATLQKTLLRVLEERRITRLGDARSRPVDVRVIVASQHDLGEEVRAGRFRADLLFRLRVARLRLPALRERREDVPLLATWFLTHARRVVGKAIGSVSDAALRGMAEYDWPGNVRELRHAIDFAVLACRSSRLEMEDLPVEIREGTLRAEPLPNPGTRRFWTRAEREHRMQQRLLDALARTGGNRVQAARLAGVSRATLYRWLAHLESTDADA